jgi:hypothetical protein
LSLGNRGAEYGRKHSPFVSIGVVKEYLPLDWLTIE